MVFHAAEYYVSGADNNMNAITSREVFLNEVNKDRRRYEIQPLPATTVRALQMAYGLSHAFPSIKEQLSPSKFVDLWMTNDESEEWVHVKRKGKVYYGHLIHDVDEPERFGYHWVIMALIAQDPLKGILNPPRKRRRTT